MNRVIDRFMSSAAWTGRDDHVQKAARDQAVLVEDAPERLTATQVSDLGVLERRPTPPAEPTPYVPLRYEVCKAEVPTYDRAALAEYIEVANAVGVAPPDLHVEEFKAYLLDSEMTVFSLETVVKFMDEKSKAEGRGWGWNWVPLREKDRIEGWFGTAASRGDDWDFLQNGALGQPILRVPTPASDHYSSSALPYDKVVPIHALRKVAQIEKGFPHKVAFMISDYAPAPAFKADPFLMAVVPNARLNQGDGRFVIDVWDEPGFGIEHMLKNGI